ncbi:50S ribosomal protein L10 [Rhodothermus bifroesti]|uniref:Large ribosomal subunit protein uL10 n=1 Tax=Rhodothermus marinus TaxID=29549 RepID=A0A7V2F4U8_RHOMR|nr:50S ribosomal protein L10 [Rhodothermus bifroesti]GBD01628.1 50S ribosomal protein L10 [bacterium HR18]
MPLTKAQKAAVLEELSEKLAATPAIYLTYYSGLNVAQLSKLRRRFREEGVEFKVVKNTLLRIAMEQRGGYEALLPLLNGPTAVAFSHEPAAPARVLKKFLAEEGVELPRLKGAFIDGAVYGADALETLASLKSKDELIADIIGLVLSPARNVVGALQGPGQQLAALVKAIAEKAEA